MKTIPTEVFTWDKEKKVFSAFASDGPLYERFRPGYGLPGMLRLESQWTGALMDVHYIRTDQHGDMETYIYGPASCKFIVQIFND